MNKLFLVTLGTIHLSLYTVLADRVQAQNFTGSYTVFGQQSGSSVQTTTWEGSINGVPLPTVTDTQTSSFSNVYPQTTYKFNGYSWSQTDVPCGINLKRDSL